MRRILKYIVHDVLAPILLWFGFDTILRSRSSNKRLIIMYHGVRQGRHRINGRHITQEAFEQQLKYLLQRYEIVPLHDICKPTSEKGDRFKIALTFDDGFLNNLTVATPLLNKYNIPATFFVCAAGLTDPCYLHATDAIDMLCDSSPAELQLNGHNFSRHGNQYHDETNQTPYQYINALSFEKWSLINQELAKRTTSSLRQSLSEMCELLDGRAIKSLLSNERLAIGSHCHHHINMTVLNADEIAYQLSESRRILEEHQDTVDALAFPYGYYNSVTVACAKALGYRILIGGGHVEKDFQQDVFPRIGVLDGASFSYSMLMIANGFKRFGF